MHKIIRNPLFLGTFVFIFQLGLILLICPEKSLSDAWLNLGSHWDSEWYEAIAQYGYVNTSFPQSSGLRTANVVFFPGYPYLARLLIFSLGISAKAAILLVAQIATWIFWCFLFHLLRTTHWTHQLTACLLIMFFPTSWFLYMGYSESLFILSSCLMIWYATQHKWFQSSLGGLVMTATRLIGLPALAAPLFATILTHLSGLKKQIKNSNYWFVFYELWPQCLIGIIGSLGCLSFLLYCQFKFGSWHLYFDMERLFWSGTADPLFLFKGATWLPPPIGYPADFAPPLPNGYASLFIFNFFRLAAYTFSETLVPLFFWLFTFVSVLTYRHRKSLDKTSLTWFIAAILLLLFNCFSLSTRHYESMSRCLYPVWILFIISEMTHPQGGSLFSCFEAAQPQSDLQQRITIDTLLIRRDAAPSPRVRGERKKVGNYFKGKRTLIPIILLYLYFSGGYWLQLLNRYFLGWWVA